MSARKCFALWVNRNGQHLWAGPFTGNRAAQDYLGRLLDTSGGSLVTTGIPMTPPEAREAAPLLSPEAPEQHAGAVTWTAHFTPEAWHDDQVIEVDPQGPQTWDCTARANANLDYLEDVAARRHESPDNPDGVLDNDDVFQHDPAAPQWIREWRGPFDIRITRTINHPRKAE